jgi:hypothetical protein
VDLKTLSDRLNYDLLPPKSFQRGVAYLALFAAIQVPIGNAFIDRMGDHIKSPIDQQSQNLQTGMSRDVNGAIHQVEQQILGSLGLHTTTSMPQHHSRTPLEIAQGLDQPTSHNP